MSNFILCPWHRIETILKNEHLSTTALALRIGLKRTTMIYAVKDHATGICPELAVRINYIFPAYSIEWMLSGVGPHPATIDEAHPQAKVSILGRWLMTGTFYYSRPWSAYRGSWHKQPEFVSNEYVWEFCESGLLHQYESGLQILTVIYAFDQYHGWLVYNNKPVLVDKLTPVEMEFTDWSDIEQGTAIRYVFKKEEFAKDPLSAEM